MAFAQFCRPLRILNVLKCTQNPTILRQVRCNHGGESTISHKSVGQGSLNPVKDAPGLSKSCINPASGEVGPGASKTGNYKNTEYFLYHSASYFEAEIEMAKYRIPQPSNKRA